MDSVYFSGNMGFQVNLVGLFVFLLCLLSIVWVTKFFNKMTQLKVLYDEGWSGVLAALKRRMEIIPNFVKAVETYIPRESETLRKITLAHEQWQSARSITETARAEADMTEALYAFRNATRNFPDLKTDKNIMEIQKELLELEKRIKITRRYYNATVRDYNMEMDQIPANFIVRLMGFKHAVYFETNEQPQNQKNERTERSD